MSFRNPLIYYLIIIITLTISFLSITFPHFAHSYGLIFAGILISLIGIPHGATDHLIFYSLSGNNISRTAQINFYVLYISSTLAFAIFWNLFPSLSLNIFISISAYHLGQSNLYYLRLPNHKIIKTLIYGFWGLFIISALIIFNTEEVHKISKYLTANIWLIDIDNKTYFLEFIIIFNFLILSGLFILKYVHHKDLFREYLNLLVLSILFYTTPLIISFGVYFGLWHSLGSTFDQIQFLKQKNSKFNIIDFSLKSIPLSIVSFIFFLIITLKLTNFSTQDLSSKTASFFIFLATITLPHTIMRDKLYQKIRC